MSTVELRHLTATEQIWLREKWVGKKFNRLTIVEVVAKSKKSHQPFGKVKCECGNVKIISLSSVATGNAKSCGCLRKEQSKRNTRSFGRYNELVKALATLEKKYDSLKKERNEKLKQQVKILKENLNGLQRENAALREANCHLKSILDNFKSIIGSRLGIKSYIKREEENK